MPRTFTVLAAVAAAATAALTALPGSAAAATGITASTTASGHHRPFLVEAHAGGLAYHPGDTLPAFAKALRMGANSLELDVQITKDGYDVVTHDRYIHPDVCQDTHPAFRGDPQYPYAGKYIKDLTLKQVRTLDCGTLTRADMPQQVPVPGARMPRLAEIFALVKAYRAWNVQVTIEAKVEAGSPTETAPQAQFARVVTRAIQRSGIRRQLNVRSFDWGELMAVHRLDRRIPIIALNQPEFLEVGQPGASPWLGGIDIDDFGGDPVKAIRSFGADGFAPVHGNPQDGAVGDPDYVPFTTRAMVREAHRYGITVVPWTVDDPATMNKLIDDGVDGITTDYVDRLRTVAKSRGYVLPPRHHHR